MKLHYSIMSPYSQKALIALYEKNIEFTPALVNLGDPEARAEYKKLYPLGKVPLLTGDDLFIPEASIIIEYLENEFSSSGTQLIPHEKTAARRVRFKDRIADLYVNDSISAIFFDSLKPEEHKNPEIVAKKHEILDTTFVYLEQELANKAYIAGDEFSMADCAMFGPLFYAQKLHPYADKPNLTAYFERLMTRDSMKKIMVELMPVLQAMNQK